MIVSFNSEAIRHEYSDGNNNNSRLIIIIGAG